MSRLAEDLSDFGILNFDGLKKRISSSKKVSFIVDGLIREHSINVVAGHSTLGKTPLAVTMGIAVASGTPFLGHSTRKGRVLYCDSESIDEQFSTLAQQISKQAELPEVPANFEVWSPNWDEGAGVDYGEALLKRIEMAEPSLVIIDPLRNFFPDMEQRADDAVKRFNRMESLAKASGASFLFVHHLRKTNAETVSIVEDPNGWFMNVAGSLAIVNRAQARLGVEASGEDDLVIGGIVRGVGRIPPIHITRDYDEDGEIRGYRRQDELDFLKDNYRAALMQLGNEFTFSEAGKALGSSSGSVSSRFLATVQRAGLVVKLPGKRYRKTRGKGSAGVLRLVA